MALPAGILVKNNAGVVFVIEAASKRSFPDATTLSLLTLGVTAAKVPTLTDAALADVADGGAFPSVAAFATANPRIAAAVQRFVRALIPASGFKDLKGGYMTLAESAAAMFADALANPANWLPIQQASKTHPLPDGFSKALSTVVTKLLNNLLSKLINEALSDDQSDAVDSTADDTSQEVEDSDSNTDPIPSKDEGEKEDTKEAGDKEAGDKEPDDKEGGEKEPDEKEPGEKEPGEKEPGEKDGKDDKDGKDGPEGDDDDDDDDDDDLDDVKTPIKKTGGPMLEWDRFRA